MDNRILKQKVPTHLAFIIILILGFLLAWFTIVSGEKVLENSKDSPTFNINKRLQK